MITYFYGLDSHKLKTERKRELESKIKINNLILTESFFIIWQEDILMKKLIYLILTQSFIIF
jgi:hypothetical protein